MRLGFVGLGRMGAPMATQLVRSGVDLLVWNRSPAAIHPLVAQGARAAESAAAVFEHCDAVIVMLANAEAIDAVLGRSADDLAVDVSGRTVITMGTTLPAYSQSLHDLVLAHGGRFVEAPVSGSRVPAEAGELVAMVAGDPASVDLVEPLLEPMTSRVFRCGEVPSALEAKLAVNVFLIAMVTALAEAVHVAERGGVDPALLQAILDAGPMASAVSRLKLAKLVDNDFAAQASVSDVLNNNQLILRTAAESGAVAPLLTVTGQLLAEAEADGHGGDDMIAVLAAMRARSANPRRTTRSWQGG